MNIEIQKGDKTVIAVTGQLDTISAVDFEKDIQQVLGDDTKDVVLDAKELTYVSSAGLRLLLTLQKGMTAKTGTLLLRNVRPEIMEIFTITGFSSILTIE